ncbi:MAG: hypothetical protein EPN47_05515 [Acidobacteria bacterium]|nr:MAG: hypothetical protein EPN47_05515 [Acidobacteriota bacterium]
MENYFNYFTEIEVCFQRARGSMTLLSTLDWALIESWKEAGIPLEAVLAGVERAFEKYQKRPQRFRKVNSLAYCSQEVLRAAEEASRTGASPAREKVTQNEPVFARNDMVNFLNRNRAVLELAAKSQDADGQGVLALDFREAAKALEEIAAHDADLEADPEGLERRLTALEDKLSASLTRAAPVELLTTFRTEMDRALAPYRRNLGRGEVESLERQFIKKGLFEHYNLPRLSLFYM